MFRIIETSTDSYENAQKIIEFVIRNKLAACAQLFENVKSMYFWKDELNHSNEYIIKFKTNDVSTDKITEAIKEISNYDVPEIISYSMSIHNEEYEDWLRSNLNP
ncbi:MAG: divalent-cation tolerance protein CutA [Candidatus Marinimicrobia bacterium]|nr:divalent-cation tolerance protein CutA [Candidatus Neomarinimicrobiota bacterium]